MKFSFTIGDTYRIRFRDHTEDSNESTIFYITGRVVASSRYSVAVAVWYYGDERDFTQDDDNIKIYSIVRMAILNAERLCHPPSSPRV